MMDVGALLAKLAGVLKLRTKYVAWLALASLFLLVSSRARTWLGLDSWATDYRAWIAIGLVASSAYLLVEATSRLTLKAGAPIRKRRARGRKLAMLSDLSPQEANVLRIAVVSGSRVFEAYSTDPGIDLLLRRGLITASSSISHGFGIGLPKPYYVDPEVFARLSAEPQILGFGDALA